MDEHSAKTYLLACRPRGVRRPFAPDRLMRRALLSIVLLCLLTAAPADASRRGGQDVVEDCAADGYIDHRGQDGRVIPGTYTQADYRDAIRGLDPIVDSYSECSAVIARAQLDAAGGARRAAIGAPPAQDPDIASRAALGDTTRPTPEESEELADVQERGDDPVELGDETVSPGEPGLTAAARGNTLPSSILVVLILTAVAVLARVAVAIQQQGLMPRAATVIRERVLPRPKG